MKRIALAVIAAVAIGFGGTAFAQQHGGGHDGGGHNGGGHDGGGAWHGGGGGWHGGGGGWHGGGWHGGSHFAIGIGFPGFYWGPGYGYPSYGYYGNPYYSAPYYTAYPYYDTAPYSYYPSEPTYTEQGNYIQRDMSAGPQPSAPQSSAQYSYYCPDPAGYYPQLQSCPKGWLKVVNERSPRPQ